MIDWERSLLAAALVIALAFAVGQAQAGLIVNTVPAWNGSNFVHAFGEPDTSLYGQTFRAPPTDPVLTSFTFLVDDTSASDVLDFDACVYGWDDVVTRATGAALYASGPHSSNNNGGMGGFQNFTMNTGSLVLTPGARYVAFFSAVHRFDGLTGQGRWAYLGTSAANGSNGYTDGNFVFQNAGNDPARITGSAWETPFYFGGQSTHDSAFTMTFEPIPEPATAWVFGAAGVVALRRRR